MRGAAGLRLAGSVAAAGGHAPAVPSGRLSSDAGCAGFGPSGTGVGPAAIAYARNRSHEPLGCIFIASGAAALSTMRAAQVCYRLRRSDAPRSRYAASPCERA
ncbi:hypothetical protein WS67_23450 [Burkholderia singularis]|uniref:Uncharacterized protein n=1 Tax=Burkholderia singularis TaxID=1503053 RepID=A0A103DWD2_9BURK|nr:hypothetical protein WS67_23450 [Burkholderia singularis]